MEIILENQVNKCRPGENIGKRFEALS